MPGPVIVIRVRGTVGLGRVCSVCSAAGCATATAAAVTSTLTDTISLRFDEETVKRWSGRRREEERCRGRGRGCRGGGKRGGMMVSTLNLLSKHFNNNWTAL